MVTLTRVMFKVKAETKIGERIHLAGENWALGGFKPQRAIELVTTPDEYPIWRTPKRIVLPTGKKIEYKYAVFSGGAFVRWEPIGQHSRYVNPSDMEMDVNDTFGAVDDSQKITNIDDEGITVEKKDIPLPKPYSFGYTASPPHIFYERASPSVRKPSPLQNERKTPPQGLRAILEPETIVEADEEETQEKMKEPTPQSSSSEDKKHAVFLVAFHLPIKLEFLKDENKWHATWNSDNVVSKTESSIAEDNEVQWVGAITHHCMPGIEDSVLWNFSEETKEAIREVLKPMRCVPIFLEKQTYLQAYNLYCKSKLRNVFHNVLELDIEAERYNSHVNYDAFRAMNQEFAYVVLSRMNQSELDDVVWVHDYHLMLVPKMIRDAINRINNILSESDVDYMDTQEKGDLLESFPTLISETTKPFSKPRIVFFLHIPFPTSEIFRTLTIRNELLLGMLSANVVGFHTFGHARHFLTSCKRFLGLQYHSRKGGTLMVDLFGRSVLIAVSHVGIEPLRLEKLLADPEVQRRARKLRQTYASKIIIAGFDELERLKGVPLKLLAYEKLLNDCPRYRGRTVFIQHGIKGSTKSRDNLISAAEVKQLVSRIISAHGPVVVYKEHNLEPPTYDRMALWVAADIMVSTPVMEGLNLYPLEYQYAHRDPAGVVILSEFSANSRVLNGALRINSYDISDIAQSLDKAIQMSQPEKEARHERDSNYIKNRKSSLWTREIIKEVESSVTAADEIITAIDHDEAHGAETVVSVQHRMDKDMCKELDSSSVLHAYQNSKRRIILLDYGGTICERELENIAVKVDFLGVSKRKLPPRVVNIIKKLSADPRNAVFIVSGNSRTVLSANFKEVLEESDSNLGLVAHSGLCVRWGNIIGKTEVSPELETREKVALRHHSSLQDDLTRSISSAVEEFPQNMNVNVRTAEEKFRQEGWEMVLKGIAQEWGEWMNSAKVPDILEDITWHTGGSVWRQSPVTTIWDFRQADPEQGGMQANILQTKLEKAIEQINVPVSIVRKKNTVQLLPKGVSKGTAVKHILERLPQKWNGSKPDFALCIGDDVADELMFTQLLESLSEGTDAHLYRPFRHENVSADETVREIFTVTVGRKPTEARYYLNNAGEVMSLLGLLTSDHE